VFTFAPPPETKEEINKDLESFAKYHEELMESEKGEIPPVLQEEGKGMGPEDEKLLEMEEIPPFFPVEKTPADVEQVGPIEEEREKRTIFEPIRTARKERRRPSTFFMMGIVLLLLIGGAFYLWTELKSGGRLARYVEHPVKQFTSLWEQVWGIEKEGLILKDLNGYKEETEDADLFVIEGRVHNQSRFAKKYVKVRVVIFDQTRAKIAEKQAICGRVLGRVELKRLPRDFLERETLKPLSEGEAVLPSGKTSPFMVIFTDLPDQAKQFEVEIVASPNV
jgi:hypothetical protein